MAGGITSGLGRNGPWIQNDWLRVETRIADGSISPVALAGAFRPAERALASVDLVDAPPLAFEHAQYDFAAHDDALGSGRKVTLTSHDARRSVVLRREVVLYGAHPFAVTRVGITNEGATPLRLGAFHAYTTPSAGRGRLQFAARPTDWRIYKHGWQSWSPTMSLGGADLDTQSQPPVLAPEPAATKRGSFASDDVSVLYDPASKRSLLIGAISARDYLARIVTDAPARSVDAACMCDGVALAPGETAWSERFAVDLCDGPNEQLERYGDALGRAMGARVPASPPSGWCSWYYFYQDVTEDDVVRNLRFLERHRRELPVETVQIDDGYQADIGDWLTVNEKFPRGMRWLASEIRAAGYTPGIWLAPFLLADSSKTFAAHPEWVVRDEPGAPAVATDNWQRKNYGLDGTHPAALAWLKDLFREICDGWGYNYVKIDFLFGAAVAGRRYDPEATRARAYRQALAAVRDAVGEQRFILGCGSLMAPSVGFFDGNRIGLDVAPWWRFLTTAERARPPLRARAPDDQLSAETAIRNTLNRSWMHNRLWANDPDCVLVRTDRTKLTLDEVRTLASVIGLSGGMTLSSDDLERLPPERLEILSMLLPPLPHAATPVDLMERDMPQRCEYVAGVDRRLVGLFNFDDQTRDLTLLLPEGRWHAFELWEERYLGEREGAVEFALVAPHACRVVALRRVTETPVAVATTAHIGMGIVDITDEHWDESAAALRLRLPAVGRRRRRLVLAAAGRLLASVQAGSGEAVTAVPVSGGAQMLELEVEDATDVVVSFG